MPLLAGEEFASVATAGRLLRFGFLIHSAFGAPGCLVPTCTAVEVRSWIRVPSRLLLWL